MSQPAPKPGPLPYEVQIIRRNLAATYKPVADPPYFAPQRINLASATTWFRNPQAGYYATLKDNPINKDEDGDMGTPFATGFLLSHHFPAGGYLDSEVLLTCLNTPGNTPLVTVKRVEEVSRNIYERRPVGVIIQQGATSRTNHGFPLFPCTDMPQDQDSWPLDWFVPTFMWKARSVTGNVIWMVRLEKYDLSKLSWFANPAHAVPPSLTERDFITKTKVEDCPVCHKQSPIVFTKGFVCLHQECSQWYKSGGEIVKHGKDWTYSDGFLQERFDRSIPVEGLDPSFPELYLGLDEFYKKNYTNLAEAVSKQAMPEQKDVVAMCQGLLKGFACPKAPEGCGMLNARVRWHEWHCSNPDCNVRISAPPPTLSPAFLSQCTTVEAAKPKWKNFDLKELPGFQGTSQRGDYTAHLYKLAEDCFISILKPNDKAVQKADEMFTKVLDQANKGQLQLERRPHQSKGGLVLTNHFTMNYGEPYIYKTHVPTIPFSEAPPPVEEAKDYMNEQLRTYFANNTGRFNQLYFACYLAAMAMRMHDDGERGLEHNVAGWTLGGRGTFLVAIKPTLDYGRPMTEKGEAKKVGKWITDDPLIKGCKEYDYRKKIQDQLKAGEITFKKWEELFAERMGKVKADGRRNLLMRFPVDHGDIVLMHGHKTQKYLEHSAEVDKDMPMRIALTFRTIRYSTAPEQESKRGRESIGKADTTGAKRHKVVG